MAGEKIFTLLLVLTSFFSVSKGKEPLVFIKGGILFEQTRDTPVTINPPTVLFHRQLNFSTLENSILQTKNFAKSYEKYCDALNRKTNLKENHKAEDKYFISLTELKPSDADGYCKSKQSSLPEIRDEVSYQELFDFAKMNNIHVIPAGVVPDFKQNIFRFVSDWSDAFYVQPIFNNIIYYYNDTVKQRPCSAGGKGGFRDDPGCLKKTEGSLGLGYVLANGKWDLTILDKRYNNVKYKVICNQNLLSREEKIQNNLLLQIAAHSCKRDLYNVQQTSETIFREAKKFIQINYERFSNKSKEITKRDSLNMSVTFTQDSLNRTKRFSYIGGAGLGLLFTEAASNTIQGKPPLDIIGKGLSYFTGLVHSSDLAPYMELLQKHSTAITELNFNQAELNKAYESMSNSIATMDSFQRRLQYSTATLFSGMDHKSSLQESIYAIQSTILKIAVVLTNAQMHICSPYLLSSSELAAMALEHRARNVFLSGDIEDVFVNVYYFDDKFVFSISVPVLNEADKYKIYKASPIPIFTGNKVYQVDMETTYLAYSINSNIYRTLQEEEFNYCRLTKYCVIGDVQRPITTNSPCSITTLSKNVQTCQLKEITANEPFYHISGNNLIYSVKGPLATTLLCPSDSNRQTFYLDGIGTAKIAPGCKIFFENDMTAIINPEPVSTNLGEIHFMEIFKYTPKINNFSVKIDYEKSTLDLYKPNITKVDTNFQSILNEIINPSTAIPHALRVIIGILICVSILVLICCCSSRFRLWFKTCTFCKNPREYWVDVKNYDIGTFNKYRPEVRSKWNNLLPPGLRNNNQPGTTRPIPPILRNNSRAKQLASCPKTIIEKHKDEERRCEESLLFKDKLMKLATGKSSTSTSIPEVPEPMPPLYPSVSYVPLQQTYYQTYLPAPKYDDLNTEQIRADLEHFSTIIIDQPMSETQRQLLVK